ncbi:MAG: hypothetical protein AAGD38_22865, partial [Acidobacteriota bacterium]
MRHVRCRVVRFVVFAIVGVILSTVPTAAQDLQIALFPNAPSNVDQTRIDASFWVTACSNGIEVEVFEDRIDFWSVEPCVCPLSGLFRRNKEVELGELSAGFIEVRAGYRNVEPCGGPPDNPIWSSGFTVDNGSQVELTSDPALPTAGESIELIIDSFGCPLDDFEVTVEGDRIEILGVDGCPVVLPPPPPYTSVVTLGALDSGTYVIELFRRFAPDDPLEESEMIARRLLEVSALSIGSVEIVPAMPRSDEPFVLTFLSSCPLVTSPVIEGSIFRIDVEIADTAACTAQPSYVNSITSGPLAAGRYFVLGIGGGPTENDRLFVEAVTITPADERPTVGDRFQIEAVWQAFDGTSGRALGSAINDDTAGFFFFSDDNLELLVKVLDGCDDNGHYWVFASGLTTVEVTLIVTDTETGEVWTHTNPLGAPFDLINDLTAFSCS